jgi:hypothetical protein
MVSFGEPANLDQLFDPLEFRVVGQDDGVEALSGGNAKSFRSGAAQRLIRRKEIDGKVFKKSRLSWRAVECALSRPALNDQPDARVNNLTAAARR